MITMEHLEKLSNISKWLSACDLPSILNFSGDLDAFREQWLEIEGRVWIILDGASMGTWESAYSELVAAFDLPDYFGRNLDALSECLTDEEVIDGNGYVIQFNEPHLALKDADSDALSGLLETFSNISIELSKPITQGNPWDRPAVPFHTILVNAESDFRLECFQNKLTNALSASECCPGEP